MMSTAMAQPSRMDPAISRFKAQKGADRGRLSQRPATSGAVPWHLWRRLFFIRGTPSQQTQNNHAVYQQIHQGACCSERFSHHSSFLVGQNINDFIFSFSSRGLNDDFVPWSLANHSTTQRRRHRDPALVDI